MLMSYEVADGDRLRPYQRFLTTILCDGHDLRRVPKTKHSTVIPNKLMEALSIVP